MQKFTKLALVTLVLMMVPIATTGYVFAQEPSGGIPEGDISITTNEIIIVAVGTLGGLTTAYLRSSKAKREAPADKPYVFDIHKFLPKVIWSVITSVTLALSSAAGFLELNLVTLFMIYVASFGTAEIASLVNSSRK